LIDGTKAMIDAGWRRHARVVPKAGWLHVTTSDHKMARIILYYRRQVEYIRCPQVNEARADIVGKKQHQGAADIEAPAGRLPLPRLLLAEVLKGGREAIIEHDGQDYRLRVTSNGKLILTK
jgi:hemin uptake protein HemP